MPATNPTLSAAMEAYLASLARSQNTVLTYRKALSAFCETLARHGLPPAETAPDRLPPDAITWFIADLKDYSPASERLYLTAAAGFYRYLAAESLAPVNLPRIKWLIDQRARKVQPRLPQFPREEIEQVLNYAQSLAEAPAEGIERLCNLRDRAFLLTLADTGLRVHEACKMLRGDLDWNEGHAAITGKGGKAAIVRFSSRAMRAIKDYLAARAALDGASGRPLSALPLFARHDRGAGKKTRPITPTTGRNIVAQRVREALGAQAEGRITPHSFRHYFVTTILRASGNLKLAQALARHASITVTQRYAHLSDDELDRGYHSVFEDRRQGDSE